QAQEDGAGTARNLRDGRRALDTVRGECVHRTRPDVVRDDRRAGLLREVPAHGLAHHAEADESEDVRVHHRWSSLSRATLQPAAVATRARPSRVRDESYRAPPEAATSAIDDGLRKA